MPSGLNFKAAGGSFVSYCLPKLFALRASSRCKHDMGTLSWLNAKHSKERPPPSLADLYGAPPVGALS